MLTLDEIQNKLNPDMLSFKKLGTGTRCLYRGPNNKKCYVGQFIPNKIARELDNSDLDSDVRSNWYDLEQYLLIQYLTEKESFEFWEEMQNIHDARARGAKPETTPMELIAKYRR